MTAQKLKNAILQLAVQGKLVPQNPSDEPAETLLKKIRKEKDKLVREGKIRKEKLLTPINDEEIPFEIPESWVWVRLEEICIINPKNSLPDEMKVSFIPMTLLEAGYKNSFSFEEKEWKCVKKNFTHFQDNDIVFAKITPCFQNRKSAILVDLLNGFGAGTTELHVLRTFSEKVYRPYILWFIKNDLFIRDGVANFTGTAGQQRVSTNYIKSYPIPLPPLEEQKRIVAKIEELLPLVEQYGAVEEEIERLNAELPDQLRKSVLQQAVQGKLVPQNPADGTAEELLKKIRKEKDKLVREGKIKKEKPLPPIDDEEIPFEIPESWAWVRLGDCNNIYTGNSINASVKQEKYSKHCNGYNFIATKDVGFDNIINYQNGIEIPKHEPNFKIAPAGSTLLCIEGGSAGRKIGLLNQDVCFGNKLCCFTSIVVFNKFVYYFLQSYAFFYEFTDSVSGIIGGVSIAKIKNLLIPLPPLAEQKRIVEKIESLLPLCDELKQR